MRISTNNIYNDRLMVQIEIKEFVIARSQQIYSTWKITKRRNFKHECLLVIDISERAKRLRYT